MTSALREMFESFGAEASGAAMPEGLGARSFAPATEPRRAYRALFLSDIHLGTRACRAEALLSFLREHEADTIYLVGDIIDFWALNRGIYWPPAHNTVVQKILEQARHGVREIGRAHV